MEAEARALGLFEGYGIELEYMIADAETLDVRPIADQVIRAEHGSIENEIERAGFAWSNELALHVIEIKTNGPVPSLTGLSAGFSEEVRRINELLAPLGARLLSTAMHPWMDPAREFAIWPHGDRVIYEAFDRIFDCRGHGWANLQSTHVNLPFANDDEFGRLHAAIRAVLPLVPALAAASPFVEGRHAGALDTRIDMYRSNARRVPSVTGAVIPEPIFTRGDYERLLASIYSDLEPLDPIGTLRREWVNARGCIARFDRMALEIRLVDAQESPQADLAIAAAVSLAVCALCDPSAAHQQRLRELGTEALGRLLRETSTAADSAKIEDREYLRALGLPALPRTAGEVWGDLIERYVDPESDASEHAPALEILLGEGPLARRLLRRLGSRPTREQLRQTYGELADCLRDGRLFRAAA